MADIKNPYNECSTCFAIVPFAEMMHTMNGQGIGSLCAEMITKIIEQHKVGCSFYDAEILRNMMEVCDRNHKEPEQTQQEKCYGSKESKTDVNEE